MVGTGHDATVRFLGAPIAYVAVDRVPLSNERKSGSSPTSVLTSGRGFESPCRITSTSRQLRRDDHAANHESAASDRRQFRYLFGGQGGVDAEDLPHDRVTGTDRYALSWKHNQNFDTVLNGLSGYVNLNKVSDDTYFSDLSDRVAFTSLTTLPREGGLAYFNGPWGVVARAQAFQTLQDPSAPQPPPYNRVPQLLVTLQDTDWVGLTFAGVAEYAYFRQPTLTTGQRVYAWPTVAWSRQAPPGFVARTAHVAIRLNEIRRAGTRPYHPDLVGGRRPRLRARLERSRRELRADARAARVLRLCAVPRPEQCAGVRHGGRRFQLQPALQREPLPRQRPDRRREPAHSRALSSRFSMRRPASSGCAWRRTASISRTSAWC
jgi:hypothetical protein